MSKKVMVTSRSFGSISSTPIDILEEAGLEVVHKGKNFDQAEFEKLIPEFDALIIGAHEFPEEVMAKCSHLEIVCKHGAGLDNIHLDKAKELGITVCNAPGTNSNAVADLAMSFMLACARKVLIADRNV
ncbi:MAG: hydroxyacid dehydrogenase, partial [Lachnospiraceae bacterium]|nr:hydroxyacid dehydrogenase [Lachnospiraceae bacterium]